MWFTPPEIAIERRVNPGKVLRWIASGQLEAFNFATDTLGRPRWRISEAALEAFDRSRSNRANKVARQVRRPAKTSGSTAYF